ncbi:MAG TPA: peptidase, partial [Clostridiales bacterium]|nr:peptidase [Clostridiales bacterium]
IPYDANEPDPTPVPPTETPEDPTPTPVPPTADPTDTPNPSTDVPENPTGAPSPTVEPNTPDVPSTGEVSIIGAGIAALIGGACVMLRKRED